MSQPSFHKEVRFAVVMYGGVSLAIYIYGVARELFNLVKATADPNSTPAGGTEKIYRELADELGAKFVVDILSGTSAGGINAVFLAKALANSQGIEHLEELWLEKADIDVLINAKDPNPSALLDGRFMYDELKRALEKMQTPNAPAAAQAQTPQPLVDELDLFVTATDLQGLTVPLKLADKVVYELRHRHVFHFRFDRAREENDFSAENDPFLAFASRCTSSFPFAFEPVSLKSLSGKALPEKWRKFCEDYLLDPKQFGKLGEDCTPEPEGPLPGKCDLFSERFFADGGYLDNKPFTYAINAIAGRGCQLPVDRKLLYIEPSPEHLSRLFTKNKAPDAIGNSVKALNLARYETIREDLEEIIRRNRLIERVDRILKGTWDDIRNSASKKSPDSVDAWLGKSLDAMIDREGIAYGGYLRLRVAQLTDDLAEIIACQAGFDTRSDLFQAVRYLVRAWRDLRYDYYPDPATGDRRKTYHQFLREFNISFFHRRIGFTLSRIDAILMAMTGPAGSAAADFPEKKQLDKFADEGRNTYRQRLSVIREQLTQYRDKILSLRKKLLKPDDKSPLTLSIRRLNPIAREITERILGGADEEERCQAARDLVRTWADQFDSMEAEVTRVIEFANKYSDLCKALLGLGTLHRADGPMQACDGSLETELREALAREDWEKAKMFCLKPTEAAGSEPAGGTAPKPPAVAQDRVPEDPDGYARWTAAFYFRRFPHYDIVAFPILYSSEIGEELDPVEVIRISPDDANGLSTRGGGKLGGSSFMHFGGFLDRTWRKNDILWGRLDAAERIISALLPGEANKTHRGDLIKRAHLAIIEESFFAPVASGGGIQPGMMDVLAMAAMGSSPDERGQSMRQLLKLAPRDSEVKLRDLIRDVVSKNLNSGRIHDWLGNYAVQRDLDPKKALQTLARSTKVVGRMLGYLSREKYKTGLGERISAWIVRIGRILWWLVEVAVPRSLPSLAFNYWFVLVFLVALAMVLAGRVMADGSTLQRLGFTIMLGEVAVLGVIGGLRMFLLRKWGWLRSLSVNTYRGLELLLTLTGVALIANGLYRAGDTWSSILNWLKGL
jgi:patatin-related protein